MTKHKNKAKHSVVLLMALLFSFGLRAQSIHFNYTDGTNASYNLEDVRKITFDADLMNLHLWDGSVFSWNVSTIGYYEYNQSSSNVRELMNNANAWDVAIFPNPTSTNLNLLYNLPNEDEITIALFDMQGKCILQKNIGKQVSGKQQQTLDVSNLPEGNYMCRINGQQQSVSKSITKH